MQVEVNPNEDTEWNDILRQHGIIPEKPKDPEPLIQEALIAAQHRAHENRLEDKDLDELDALEEDEDEEFLEIYRQKRLAELSHLQQTSLFNQVIPLQKVDYAREVTEASNSAFVLVNLTSMGGNVESRVLTELWRQLAAKFGDIKFCEIRADMCIEGYPEKNTPTILAYKDTEIKKQLITLQQLKGPRTKIEDLESLLVEIGALKESDVRLKKRDDEDDYKKDEDLNIEDFDDDWD
ncbi:Phosducin family protein [Penicillium digitatum]|uniref:Phosducin family protein n=3 Tax=Penicillium digitatum TaxID=36651 RepID=K9FGZ7_PEND2|nr:Phosducin family protein [Penicillium digitatum Pd1]EKV06960.1 Phosducin family protein [Penicillium digitatum Pd1]EKV08770.1 Phosducin family protein [Penicillium digitatum PHI26]QQK41034.1 Phosducin family protein [Penicillium digitatum]